MSLLQRILCRLGFHDRSRSKARKTEAGWKSVCRGCGKPMIKLKGGDWRVMLPVQIRPTKDERARAREAEARRRRMPPPRRKRPTDRQG